MKTDLVTAIGAAIVGFLIAFFVTDLLTEDIKDFTFTTVDSKVSTELKEPDPEVFNYYALNPTVEVYIGSCIEYDENGECVEILTEEVSDNESIEESETVQEN